MKTPKRFPVSVEYPSIIAMAVVYARVSPLWLAVLLFHLQQHIVSAAPLHTRLRDLQGDECSGQNKKNCNAPSCAWSQGNCIPLVPSSCDGLGNGECDATPGCEWNRGDCIGASPTSASPTASPFTAVPTTTNPTTSPFTAPPSVSPTKQPTSSPDGGPTSPGLASIADLQYSGAFRLKPGNFGAGPDGTCTSSQATHCSINYAVGTLAYNPTRNSLYIVGHAQASLVAEYPLEGVVPDSSTFDVTQLPVTADPIQPFTQILSIAPNPEGHNRITGMMCYENELIINSEDWYDAAADNYDTTLAIRDSSNLSGTIDGYFKHPGRANAAGYMGTIPLSLQSKFGGSQYYMGWSSVYSITSRYSQGPSIWSLHPSEMTRAANGALTSTSFMNFPYSGGSDQWLSPTANSYSPQGEEGPFPPADPVWNALTIGVYGFFIPGTRTYMVIGSTGGLTSGIGYKAVQSDGNICGGPCAYDPDDYYNYYWLFDADEISNAENVWDPRPYEYGIWELPSQFITSASSNLIKGGSLDEANGVLYVALANAAQVGAYDRPPLVLTYGLPVL